MSIFTEPLPEQLIIRGEPCPIHTDFQTWLSFSELMGRKMPETEKIIRVFKLVFAEQPPPNLFDGVAAIMEFYTHGSIGNEAGASEPPEESIPKRYFDFEVDADLIYAAFLQQYGIDLCENTMHWWRFKALLAGLSEDTMFTKVVGYRSLDISSVKDKEQKAFYRKMKRRYRLPDNRSEEERERQMNAVLETIF